jgi:hypothetical protein
MSPKWTVGIVKRQLLKGRVLEDWTTDGDIHTEKVRSMA